MSTDYSKMSDTEIAQKVFFWLSSDFCPNGGLAHINSDCFFFFDNRNVKRKFDPCNNPADAWPIIVGNKISIVSLDNKWIAAPVDTVIDGITGDSEVCFYASYDAVSDVNPLRAAMIVFLMMQESKNAS